jgi:hypothetical protein
MFLRLHAVGIDLLHSLSFRLATLVAVAACAGVAVEGAACSTMALPPTDTGGSGNPSPGGGGPGGDGGTGAPSTCGFGTPAVPFALPSIVGAPSPAFTALSDSVACATGTNKLTYGLAYMNADAFQDLVVTSACDDATVGVSVWLVYLGTATGFATAPVRFTLPPAPTPEGCATTNSIFDINGDLVPDYVVTTLCNDPTVGTSRWLFFAGSATGFAQTATPYPLPPGASSGAFATTGTTTSSCQGAANAPAFQLFDINGDDIPDFVITQACGNVAIGTTDWQVYLGSATGAAQTSELFPLPTSPTVTTGAFAGISGALSCSATVTVPQFALIDYDADGKLDMMVTATCSEATVGTSAWLYYPNSGQGFAASPVTLGLPTVSGAATGSFTALSATGHCSNGTGTPTYTLGDLNGDLRPDLILLADCANPATGISYWELYLNETSGFASTVARFALPSALGASSSALAGFSGTAACTASPDRPAFTTTYLDDTTSLDLVVTSECGSALVGESEWQVYPASCH